MQAKLVITIDVEEDSWDRFEPGDDTLENIKRITPLQELFDRYGAIPTYLVTYPVLVNRDAMGLLAGIHRRGRCEIGAHCHPWNTPPLRETISPENTYMCNLPASLVMEKMDTLTRAMRDRLGAQPESFRAGRWGFGPSVASVLSECGYTVDSSVTPFWSWLEFGGPDFTDAPRAPYLFDPANVLEPKPDGKLMEIPPTIGFLQNHADRAGRLRRRVVGSAIGRLHLMGMLDRLNLVRFRWLTPELWGGSDMVALAKAVLRSGCPILNMTLHSVSMLPGRSEFVKSEEDVTAFLASIETVLSFAVSQGIQFSTLRDAAESVRRAS